MRSAAIRSRGSRRAEDPEAGRIEPGRSMAATVPAAIALPRAQTPGGNEPDASDRAREDQQRRPRRTPRDGQDLPPRGAAVSRRKTNRLGTIEAGHDVGDWDDDEKRRQLRLGSLAHVEREGLTFNLIDTPGDPGFQADTLAALRVVEAALVVSHG